MGGRRGGGRGAARGAVPGRGVLGGAGGCSPRAPSPPPTRGRGRVLGVRRGAAGEWLWRVLGR